MHRRRFLALTAALGSVSGHPTLAQSASIPTDPPRELPVTGADLGTLYADVEKIAGAKP